MHEFAIGFGTLLPHFVISIRMSKNRVEERYRPSKLFICIEFAGWDSQPATTLVHK